MGEIYMNTSDAAKAIKNLARQNGVSIREYRGEIERAITLAMTDPDPVARAHWAKMPRKGERPTPEEFIIYMAEQTTNRL